MMINKDIYESQCYVTCMTEFHPFTLVYTINTLLPHILVQFVNYETDIIERVEAYSGTHSETPTPVRASLSTLAFVLFL